MLELFDKNGNKKQFIESNDTENFSIYSEFIDVSSYGSNPIEQIINFIKTFLNQKDNGKAYHYLLITSSTTYYVDGFYINVGKGYGSFIAHSYNELCYHIYFQNGVSYYNQL